MQLPVQAGSFSGQMVTVGAALKVFAAHYFVKSFVVPQKFRMTASQNPSSMPTAKVCLEGIVDGNLVGHGHGGPYVGH